MVSSIKKSELIINRDGSIFHLRLLPDDISDTVLLVGDPKRVYMVANFFHNIEFEKKNREFVTITGTYKRKRITVLSTGIGTDNMDIVLNELDALVNIDLKTCKVKKRLQTLNLIRIGTSGAIQSDIPLNTFLLSEKSIGFDGLLNFYADRERVTDINFEKKFIKHTNWNERLAKPYVVDASEDLNNLLKNHQNIQTGVTISANGFYGPQGRVLRLDVLDKSLNEKLAEFTYLDIYHLTNYEMESSALFGLASMLGHRAACICLIIANRATNATTGDYTPMMNELIKHVLEAISSERL